MPVKLFNCALLLTKVLCVFLLLPCSHGFYFLCDWTYCGTLVHLYHSSPAADLCLHPCKDCLWKCCVKFFPVMAVCTDLWVCFCFQQAEAAPEGGRDVASAQVSSGQQSSEPAAAAQSVVAPAAVSAGASAAASFFIRYFLFLRVSITAHGSSNSWEVLLSAGWWRVELVTWSWLWFYCCHWRAGMGWGRLWFSLSGGLEPLWTKPQENMSRPWLCLDLNAHLHHKSAIL